MDALLLQYLDKALDMEEAGYTEQALALVEKMMATFVEHREMLLLEQAKMKFRNGYSKEALMDFIMLYESTRDEEVYELILEAYYAPNKEALDAVYKSNMELLKNYPNYRNSYEGEALSVFPIWQDDETVICVDPKEKQFAMSMRERREYSSEEDDVAMLVNELWLEEIWKCEENSRISHSFLGMELPMYLVFDKGCGALFMQLYQIADLLEKKRIVILIGRESLSEYLQEDMVLFPQRLFAADGQVETGYKEILRKSRNEIARKMKSNWEKIGEYYQGREKEINQRIKRKVPRILFITSRFTTALQYHTRDCMQAAGRLGCDTRIELEEDDIHRDTGKDRVHNIADFQPDIVFVLDHFRHELSLVPAQAVFITWVQDPLDHIMDKENVEKLGDRDFVMNHFITWKTFQEIGYPQKALIDAPIPANQYIYKPYALSEEEKKEYTCDICFVCHASDVDGHIEEVIARFPQAEEMRELISSVYKGYQSYVYEAGVPFYEEGTFAEFVYGAISQCYQFTPSGKLVEFLANDMCMWFNQRVYRQALVDWIIDAGFTNIKLWGNGWKEIPKYAKYAMGPAQNGEILSKIYQASKIVIGNNIMTTAAARAWETMLSGGFYMSNYIPPESDVTDIRKIIEADRDVVMFYNREDLIQKIHYYLEHEEARQEMIKRGRKVSLEKMTYDVLMERVINEVAVRLEANNHE